MESNSLPCDTGRCKAECCGVVPIPEDIYIRNRHLLQRRVKVLDNIFPGQIIAADKNLVCGFLTADFKCAIYNERPEVCRKFGSIGETHEMLICAHKKKWMSQGEVLFIDMKKG
jgi:Fe-S-cluster containining protein